MSEGEGGKEGGREGEREGSNAWNKHLLLQVVMWRRWGVMSEGGGSEREGRREGGEQCMGQTSTLASGKVIGVCCYGGRV